MYEGIEVFSIDSICDLLVIIDYYDLKGHSCKVIIEIVKNIGEISFIWNIWIGKEWDSA